MKLSQIEMQEHSKAKVDLLKTYLERYLAVIANDGFTHSIDLIDMFCGEGLYPNGEEGSPIAIARSLENLCRARKGNSIPSLRFTWNDENATKVDQVTNHLAKTGLARHPAITLTPSNRNYSEVIEEIKTKVSHLTRKQKAFIFIDPYGYKDVKPSHIRELLLGGQSELLLFQPTQHLFRFSERGTPSALSDFMHEVSNGESWPTGLTVHEYIRHTTELFRLYLGDQYFVDTFTIEKDQPKAVFCLFFFSPHIRGFEKMLDAKWTMDSDNGQGWHHQDSMPVFDLFNTPQTNVLEAYLAKILPTRPFWSNGELFEMILRYGFLPKHGRQVLSAWQKIGKIVVEPRSTKAGVFHLSYEDYKKQSGKLKISKVF